MNAEIKRKWVAALRSVEFKQGHGSLRDEDRLCCLGVLCELHRKAHPGLEWEEGRSVPFYYLGVATVLPDVVREWAGLTEADPSVGRDSLSILNDAGRTFAEIADIIEARL